MPGMNASSVSAFGILANSLYLRLLITGVIGLFAALILINGLAILGNYTKFNIRSFFISGPDKDSIFRYPSKREEFIRIAFGVMWTVDGLFQLRPDMPGGFVQEVAYPALKGAPGWIISLSAPLLNLWNAHPVNIDIVTAWIQIFIGLGYLLTTSGVARRTAIYLSLIWGVIILTVGNGLGLFYPGAAWMTGAPSAIYVYAFAAVYLLAADSGHQWTRTSKTIAYFLASFLAAGAILEALPSEHYWSKGGISSMAGSMARSPQPHIISISLSLFARLAQGNPVLVNAILVALPLVAAIAIAIRPINPSIIYFVATTEFFAWWFGMDFGIFSSTATDFNSGLPIVLIALSLLRSPVDEPSSPEDVGLAAEYISNTSFKMRSRIYRPHLYCLSFFALLASSFIALVSLNGPASTDMAMINSGGFQTLPSKAIPNFTLTDYNGKAFTVSALRGKPVVVVFLNPECHDTCSLLALEMAKADTKVEGKTAHISLVAITSSALFHTVAETKTFTYNHQLEKYRNWHFLSGSLDQLRMIWGDFGEPVQAKQRSSPFNPPQFYFINKSGLETFLLTGSNNEQLAASYESLLAQKLRKLL